MQHLDGSLAASRQKPSGTKQPYEVKPDAFPRQTAAHRPFQRKEMQETAIAPELRSVF